MSRYIESIAQISADKALKLSQRAELVTKEVITAVHHFLRIGSYFEKDRGYSRQAYKIIAGKVFSRLIDPMQGLIEESLQSGQLPETSLIKAMQPRKMAYLLLYACYSLGNDCRRIAYGGNLSLKILAVDEIDIYIGV